MYHKATACNVIPDIVEVVNLLQTILSCCNTNADGKIFISPILLYSPLLVDQCGKIFEVGHHLRAAYRKYFGLKFGSII